MERKIVATAEAWDFSDGPVFAFTAICWKERGNLYHIRHPERTFELEALEGDLVPMSHVYAEAKPEYSRAPEPLPENAYVKQPNTIGYDKTHPSFGAEMITEIKAYETIRQQPHPNLAGYRGCICEGGYVVALCLKSYRATLGQAVEGSDKLDYLAIMEGARKVASHLHSLGLVHNDINPANIMVDEHNKGVLIDFDSCNLDGHKFPIGSKTGIMNWTRHDGVSERENDLYSLNKLAEWLKEKGIL
ncbi:hypothetical protein BDV93DRAFT_572807 [Ceratobasidium sp. AG-I]|nr:hypothetical protein BDV93DRAFT_572807 [Ceratobasidium sp. AG-I]